MKITKVEFSRTKEPVRLKYPWKRDYAGLDGSIEESTFFCFICVHTDDGIVGYGPCSPVSCSQRNPIIDTLTSSVLIGLDPFYVERFWDVCMKGRDVSYGRDTYAGVEIALWDIIGKSADQPLFKLLGAHKDKVLAYVSTLQLLTSEDHVKQAITLAEKGIQAIKLRMHREDPDEDLQVVRDVAAAVGDKMKILVDANQNHISAQYPFWSKNVALRIAKELDKLNIFLLEDPLPKIDIDGLAEINKKVDMPISGGEHSSNIFDLAEALSRGAYDIIQPDLVLGNIGITGLRKLSAIAESMGKLIIPHVCFDGQHGLFLAATLQVIGSINNCPYVEYILEPPSVTPEVYQLINKDKIMIDDDGYVAIPAKPGLGIEVDQEFVDEYMETFVIAGGD